MCFMNNWSCGLERAAAVKINQCRDQNDNYNGELSNNEKIV